MVRKSIMGWYRCTLRVCCTSAIITRRVTHPSIHYHCRILAIINNVMRLMPVVYRCRGWLQLIGLHPLVVIKTIQKKPTFTRSLLFTLVHTMWCRNHAATCPRKLKLVQRNCPRSLSRHPTRYFVEGRKFLIASPTCQVGPIKAHFLDAKLFTCAPFFSCERSMRKTAVKKIKEALDQKSE